MSVYCVCALSIARTCVATWNCCARACVRMCTTVPSMSNNLMCDVTPRQRGSNAFLSFAPSLSTYCFPMMRSLLLLRLVSCSTTAAPVKKYKVLCLHGYSQNPSVFRDRSGGFRKPLKKAEKVLVLGWITDHS